MMMMSELPQESEGNGGEGGFEDPFPTLSEGSSQ